MPTKTAAATWNGSLPSGQGQLRTESGAVDTPFTWASRSQTTEGTSPEELLAAAHAGCFSMALAHALTERGNEPISINTTGKVTFGAVDGGFAITHIQLLTTADVPGIAEAAFLEVAETTKNACPVSAAIAVPISLTATLSS